MDGHKEIFDEIYAATKNPRMEYKLLNDCGHLPQDEKPQEVMECVVNFLFKVGI